MLKFVILNAVKNLSIVIIIRPFALAQGDEHTTVGEGLLTEPGN